MKTPKIAFTIFLMLFVLVLLFLTPGYDRESALFPILVGSATLLLGVLALATELVPRLGRLAETNLFEVGAEGEKGMKRAAEVIDFRNFLRTGFWLVLFL